MIRTLNAHPSSASSSAFFQIESLSRTDNITLDVAYHIRGDIAKLVIPKQLKHPARTDNLWKSTCCEIFLRRAGHLTPYLEFNFAPSGQWAYYRFSGYRTEMERPDVNEHPIVITQIQAKIISLEVQVPWFIIDAHLPGTQPLEAGISVILKEKDGAISYWAVEHPLEQPDFHHPESFFTL